MIASPFRLAFAVAFVASFAVMPAAASPELSAAARANVSQPTAKKPTATPSRHVRSQRSPVRSVEVHSGGCLAGCAKRLTLVGAGFGF